MAKKRSHPYAKEYFKAARFGMQTSPVEGSHFKRLFQSKTLLRTKSETFGCNHYDCVEKSLDRDVKPKYAEAGNKNGGSLK